MGRKRRTHSPECKTKVALATPQGGLAMAELINLAFCARAPLRPAVLWHLQLDDRVLDRLVEYSMRPPR